MGNILKKERVKNSRLSLVSFLLGLLPIAYIIGITIKDILFPKYLNSINGENMRNTLIAMWILTVTGIIGILIASISLPKKRCSKKLGVWAIILNSIIPVLDIVIFVFAWIDAFVLKSYK